MEIVIIFIVKLVLLLVLEFENEDYEKFMICFCVFWNLFFI